MVDEATALRVAKQEEKAWGTCGEGFYGEELRDKALKEGLDLIAFEMVERPKGWEVHDLITGKEHWWPHKAQCPSCKKKGVECRRGNLTEHHIKSDHRLYECPDRSFMGHEVSHEL
jgi:hypothetical protein